MLSFFGVCVQSHWVADGLVQHKAHERRCIQALGWTQAGGGRAGKNDCEMEIGHALGFQISTPVLTQILYHEIVNHRYHTALDASA